MRYSELSILSTLWCWELCKNNAYDVKDFNENLVVFKLALIWHIYI